jgi:hypothetical protein
MPVLHASSLALFVVGNLEARDGDAHEQSKKLVSTRVLVAARVEWKLRHTTP